MKALLLFLSFMYIAGCGVKGDPMPPEARPTVTSPDARPQADGATLSPSAEEALKKSDGETINGQ